MAIALLLVLLTLTLVFCAGENRKDRKRAQ